MEVKKKKIKVYDEKEKETYPSVYSATYFIDSKGKAEKGFIFIHCPYCEKELFVSEEPTFCEKCRGNILALYKINWKEDVKYKFVYNLIELYIWQPKSYRKRDIKEVLKQEGELIALFKIKEKREDKNGR